MPKKRVLSEFMCRELLYDYVSGNTDAVRKLAIEESLKEYDEVRDDLKALNEGLKYCARIGQSKVTKSYVDLLSRPPKGLSEYVESWKKLPFSIRITVEAIGVAAMISATLTLLPKKFQPWNQTTEFIISEATREKGASSQDQVEAITTTSVQTVTTETYGPPRGPLVVPGPVAKVAEIPKAESIQPKPPVAGDKPVEKVVEKVAEKSTAAKPRGEIYRLYMKSDKLDSVTLDTVKKITELGGQKAGEVELGWKRKGGSYFHFSLPISNLDSLKNYLQNFGPVRIVREPHVRVMPEGQIRLILWIEQTGSTTEQNDNSGQDGE